MYLQSEHVTVFLGNKFQVNRNNNIKIKTNEQSEIEFNSMVY